MAVVQLSSTSSLTLEPLSGISLSYPPTIVPLKDASTHHYYKIEDKRQSECTQVLFTSQTSTSERVVMKLLHSYKDTRYSLETTARRQQCQLVALQRNRVFTPEVYIGLARVDEIDLNEKHVCIGAILNNPAQEELEPEAEYALLMHRLPEERRLEVLLQEDDECSLRKHLRMLTEHIVSLHTQSVPFHPNGDETQWGSYEQLRRKLLHNFGLIDLIITGYQDDYGISYDELNRRVDYLKASTYKLFSKKEACFAFEQRVQEQRIKLCHGDLKSPNIWILPCDDQRNEGTEQYVKILDAIDFNPAYCHVDILSDFAMLVVDIQTRTKSVSLANEMIEYYLELTDQTDEVSRFVLGFYLVEKAIVGTAISIAYDHLIEFGLSLLEVAEMRLHCLIHGQPTHSL